MIDQEVASVFKSKKIFINEFLKTSEKWVSNFCENWIKKHRASKSVLDFFNTIHEYRLVVEFYLEKSKSSSRSHENAATLQGQQQQQQQQQQQNGGKKCLCEQTHLFKSCFYMIKATQSIEWKEDAKIKEKIRKQLENIHSKMYEAIKYVADTNILNEIFFLKEKKKSEDTSKLSITDEQQARFFSTFSYFFENMTIRNRSNSLYHSVIYDSRCDFFLIHEKSPFISDIASISTDQWCDTSDDEMLVVDYEIMKMIDRDDHDQFVKLLFKNCW